MSAVGAPEAAERFVEKWKDAELSERAASHEHIIDLCRLIGQPTPAEANRIARDYSTLSAMVCRIRIWPLP